MAQTWRSLYYTHITLKKKRDGVCLACNIRRYHTLSDKTSCTKIKHVRSAISFVWLGCYLSTLRPCTLPSWWWSVSSVRSTVDLYQILYTRSVLKILHYFVIEHANCSPIVVIKHAYRNECVQMLKFDWVRMYQCEYVNIGIEERRRIHR